MEQNRKDWNEKGRKNTVEIRREQSGMLQNGIECSNNKERKTEDQNKMEHEELE